MTHRTKKVEKLRNKRMMEILGHLLMIEDKLFNYNKRCLKCVKETILTVESICDKIMDSHHKNEIQLYSSIKDLPNELRTFCKRLQKCKKESDYNNLTQGMRIIRKDLTKKYFYNDRKITDANLRRLVNHKCPRNILPILDPRFNIREVCKNVLLLKNHLMVPENRCIQCIRKHSMIIEAFLEEGHSLDKGGKHAKLFNCEAKRIRKIQCMLKANGRDAYYDMKKELDKMQKKVFDVAWDFVDLC